MRQLFETLTPEQISNIIPVVERGLDLERIEYLATQNPEARGRIADSSVFLSLLRARQLYVDGSGCSDTDHIG